MIVFFKNKIIKFFKHYLHRIKELSTRYLTTIFLWFYRN